MKHGTLTTYTKRGCRCRECRDAQRDYQREKRGVLVVDERRFGDLLHELFPDGLTDDCPARRRIAA